jgi:hypothetical protein
LPALRFGTAFRLWAINTLKNNFAATVQIKQGQQLITSGPYRWLRHPSYTGAWIAMIGAALLMHSYLGLVLMGPGMLLVYMRRIAVEERTLEQAFGQAYTSMKHEHPAAGAGGVVNSVLPSIRITGTNRIKPNTMKHFLTLHSSLITCALRRQRPVAHR